MSFPVPLSVAKGVRLRVEPSSNRRIDFHCPVLLSLVVGAYFSHPLQAQSCEKIRHGQDFYFKKLSRRRFCPALAKRSFLQPGGPVLYQRHRRRRSDGFEYQKPIAIRRNIETRKLEIQAVDLSGAGGADSSRRPVRAHDSHTASKSRAGVEMSNERSLLGTSLAAETSFQQFFWNQRFKPGFLESLDTARRSACATKSRSR